MEPIKKDLAKFRKSTPKSQSFRSRTNEENYTGPDYAKGCAACKGAGVVHPRYNDGKVIYAEIIDCPLCHDNMEGALRFGVNSKASFETYHVVKGQNDEAFKASKAFYEGRVKFLLLLGRPGCGKTHLCNAVALAHRLKGLVCKFITVAELLSEFRACYTPESLETYIATIKGYSVLILDDFGAEQQTEWSVSRIQEIIDARYAKTKNGDPFPTMIATNQNLEELPQRMMSRFQDVEISRAILNKAPDYRVKPY
ncbi:MAG: ATP-binding protein [Dehalococcoidia bacterium]|nr:ATP-binding protein [Dehalococcoidia bacterium]